MWRSIMLCSVVLLLALPIASNSATIDSVFSLRDNEAVVLQGAYVARVIGCYAFVKSTNAGGGMLPVYTRAIVHGGWVVEITGHTATAGGKRVVVAQQVRLYVDSHGKPLPPMPDGYYTGSDAPGTVAVAQQMQSASYDDMPQPPDPTEPTGGSSLPLSFTEGTIAWAKAQEDGAGASLTGKIITRDWLDYFYIEEDNRSSGIRVQLDNHTCHKGERVSVVGTLATNADSERYIAATGITYIEVGSLIPLAMNNNLLGGGDFAYDPGPPISGQLGITGASGLNNIGLLVRTWGKITALDTANPPQWFRIDDGSGVTPKVAYSPGNLTTDDYVTITGISSCELSGGDLLRVIRPGSTDDLAKSTGLVAPTVVDDGSTIAPSSPLHASWS